MGRSSSTSIEHPGSRRRWQRSGLMSRSSAASKRRPLCQTVIVRCFTFDVTAPRAPQGREWASMVMPVPRGRPAARTVCLMGITEMGLLPLSENASFRSGWGMPVDIPDPVLSSGYGRRTGGPPGETKTHQAIEIAVARGPGRIPGTNVVLGIARFRPNPHSQGRRLGNACRATLSHNH